jgi:hypothetical protein
VTLAYMPISKKIKDLVRGTMPKAGDTMTLVETDTENTWELELEGFGLIYQMDNLFVPSFNYIEADCRSLAREHDCFQRVEFSMSAAVILSKDKMTQPYLKVTFYKQRVANARLK